jgi:hypothetical protein
MFRVSKGVAAGIVAGAVLLRGTAHAQVTTTTTTSTTTTTLQPHRYGRATGACVRRTRHKFKMCRITRAATCLTDFQTAFSNCFAAPASVKCAKSCVTKQSTCAAAVLATEKACRKACIVTRKADKKACLLIADGDTIWAGGDAACLTTADANFHLCLFGCAEAGLDYQNNFTFCIADCPIYDDVYSLRSRCPTPSQPRQNPRVARPVMKPAG